MNRHALWMLLCVSLTFNMAVVAGYLWPRATAPTSDEDIRALPSIFSDDLALDEHQREQFSQLHEALSEDGRALRDAIFLARKDLWQEMTNSQPDAQRLSELETRIANLYEQLGGMTSEHFQKFMHVLHERQRDAVMEKLENREAVLQAHRALIERFDLDGDGRLDEQELAMAREVLSPEFLREHRKRMRELWRERGEVAHEARRHAFEQRRRALIERFDKDGDGRLDEEERAAMMQYLRELREQRERERDRHRDGRDAAGERAPDRPPFDRMQSDRDHPRPERDRSRPAPRERSEQNGPGDTGS